ncbi:PSD1 and planctomycete cytochrome C domain-containing protein [Planctomycetaceae bacterium]|nr:PSD1 and planctomycete cytochrome C domain-containing protein [Planctomycetaceae bacterium]
MNSRSSTFYVFIVFTLLLGVTSIFSTRAPGQEETVVPKASSVDFAKDVLPILKQNCFECHHEEAREGGLRFFGHKDLLELNDSGMSAVTPGKSMESELIRRVTTDDELERMPPEGEGLTKSQVETLRAWIDAGAEWPAEFATNESHWSYELPVRPERPTVQNDEWCQNELDYFVLHKLQEAGLKPSDRAEDSILLRRLYLDVIGIPPTVEQIDAYRTDTTPNKYEKMVDTLLARPQFGEKWARHWLDLARYADSNGYQADQFREIWPWRDWVIKSMNDDMPFDQFTIEQLAGDLLPEATVDQKIATGFQRCTTCNVEAGVDPEENRVNQVIDRVNTLGMVWLGTSMECAQCHNHKYDPFTMKDYYSLFAYFNNTPLEVIQNGMSVTFEVSGPKMPLPLPPDLQKRRNALEARQKQLNQKITDRKKGLRSEQAKFEATLIDSLKTSPSWHVLENSEFTATGQQPEFIILEDNSILLSGPNPPKTTYTVKATTNVAEITGFKLEALTHDSLPGKGPGRGDDERPNFVLYDFGINVAPADHPKQTTPVAFRSAKADFSQSNWDVKGLIDADKKKTGWAINPQFSKDHWATFVTKKTLNPEGNEVVFTITLPQHFGSARTIGRLRLSVMTGSPGAYSVPEDVQKALKVASDQRDKKQQQAITEFQQKRDKKIVTLNKNLKETETLLKEVEPVTTLVMVEMEEDRETFIMKRGNFLDPGATVTKDTPEVLHEAPDKTLKNRLGLANWIVSPENPLVRRVVVNRWWAEIFGEGLVSTSEDFGSQGERPTHPRVLDWLAVEFLESNWSMKHVVKQIVMSATYQQESLITPELLETDPYNKLLARGPRIRMTAETIRDNALQVSGLLSDKMAGPPIYPPQPDNIWRHVGRNAPKYQTDTNEDRFRRGIYVVWRRSAPYPSFVTFDAPDRASCVIQRSRTNTPLQALTLLNDPAYVEIGHAFAERVLKESPSGDPSEQIKYAFRSCTAREPNERELNILNQIYLDENKRLNGDKKTLEQLIPDIELSAEKKLERGVWFYLGNILLNLDETITKS